MSTHYAQIRYSKNTEQDFKYLISMDLVPIGKHRGEKYKDLPDDYLQWVVGQKKFTVKRVKQLCLRELQRRGLSEIPDHEIDRNQYKFRMPSGRVTMIPTWVDMTVRENEECPF